MRRKWESDRAAIGIEQDLSSVKCLWPPSDSIISYAKCSNCAVSKATIVLSVIPLVVVMYNVLESFLVLRALAIVTCVAIISVVKTSQEQLCGIMSIRRKETS